MKKKRKTLNTNYWEDDGYSISFVITTILTLFFAGYISAHNGDGVGMFFLALVALSFPAVLVFYIIYYSIYALIGIIVSIYNRRIENKNQKDDENFRINKQLENIEKQRLEILEVLKIDELNWKELKPDKMIELYNLFKIRKNEIFQVEKIDKTSSEIILDLNLSNKTWDNYNDKRKIEVFNIYKAKGRVKEDFVNRKIIENKNRSNYKGISEKRLRKIFDDEIEAEWKKLTIDELWLDIQQKDVQERNKRLKEEERNRKLLNQKYDSLIYNGNKAFENKNYYLAKEYYEKALEIRNNFQISDRLKDISKIIQRKEDEEKKLKDREERSRRQRERLENTLYIFFDTETNGLPIDYNASISNSDNWPRLVQLAWQVYDGSGNFLGANSFIVKPSNFTIPKIASNIHGITTEIALEQGENLKLVLEKFQDILEGASFIVGHNIEFDRKIMASEFYRMNISNPLRGIKEICTMKKSTNFCRIEGRYGYKYPTLQELYNYIVGPEKINAHNAEADVQATVECFFALKQRRVITD